MSAAEDVDDRAHRAALHALGLLEGRDAEEAAAREAADPAFAAETGALRDRFLALDLTAPRAAPAPDGWDRIAAALDAAPAPRPAARPARRAGRRPAPDRPRRFALGRAALGAAAACALFAAGALFRGLTEPAPLAVAVLLDDAGRQVAMVEAFGDDSVRVTPLAGLTPEAAQALELWTLPDPETGPVSLGLLRDLARVRLDGPDLARPREGQLYEITAEPPGGSPTGRPTGPIIGKGFAREAL